MDKNWTSLIGIAVLALGIAIAVMCATGNLPQLATEESIIPAEIVENNLKLREKGEINGIRGYMTIHSISGSYAKIYIDNKTHDGETVTVPAYYRPVFSTHDTFIAVEIRDDTFKELGRFQRGKVSKQAFAEQK